MADRTEAPTTSPTRHPGVVAALAIAVVVGLGFGLIVPVLPLFARDFGVGLVAVTLVVSVFALVKLVTNLYAGALTDRFGSRAAVVAGALVVAASSLATAAAPTYVALVALRGVGGFGSALFLAGLLALVLTSVPARSRGRAVGLLQGAFGVGVALGPAFGGLLAAPLGLRWPFVIYAGFCVAAAVVARTLVPAPDGAGVDGARRSAAAGAAGAQPGGPRGARALLGAARDLCRDPTVVAALVMMVAARWANQGLRFSLVPVLGVEEVGAGELLVGVGLSVAALTQLAASWPSGWLADRYGRRAVAVPGYLAFAVVCVALGLVAGEAAFVVMLAAYGVGAAVSLTPPAAMLGDAVPTERTGVGVGLLNTAGDLGAVLGPPVSGLLAQAVGYPAGFGAAGALLVVGAVAAWRARETRPAAAG